VLVGSVAGSVAVAVSVAGVGSAVGAGSAGAGSPVVESAPPEPSPVESSSGRIESAEVEMVASPLGVGSGVGVTVGSGLGEVLGSGVGAGVGSGVAVGSGSGSGVVEGGVDEPTVAGPEVPGPQFKVLDELLELDELVTVPLPSSVVTGVLGLPPEETSTQFDDGDELGVNVVVVATRTARFSASCTAGLFTDRAPESPPVAPEPRIEIPAGDGGAESRGLSTDTAPATEWPEVAAFAGRTVITEARMSATADTTAVTHVLAAEIMIRSLQSVTAGGPGDTGMAKTGPCEHRPRRTRSARLLRVDDAVSR
jgi:hypothetical protein